MVLPGDDDLFAAHAAPVSYAMDSVDGAGYRGTCTIAGTHAGGFKLRAHGDGVPNSWIRFNLVDVTAPEGYRTTAVVQVNHNGNFRTGWDVMGPATFPSNHFVECWLTAGSSNVLARSMSFQVP